MLSLSEGISIGQQVLAKANKIADRFANIDTSDRFNPDKSDDIIAKKISWNSINADASGQRLVEVGDSKIAYKQTKTSKIAAFVFMGIGIATMLLPVYKFVLNNFTHYNFGMSIFGFIFFLVGYLILYTSSQEVSFDKDTGLFIKGKKSNIKFIEEPYESHNLDKIHALQIVHKDEIENNQRSDDDNFFDSHSKVVRYYQLNVILKSAKRINISSASSYNLIMTEARVISDFLNKPIWNFADMHVAQLESYKYS